MPCLFFALLYVETQFKKHHYESAENVYRIEIQPLRRLQEFFIRVKPANLLC